MFSASDLDLPTLPYIENGWDIFVTQSLMNLKILNHDKIWIDKKVISPELSTDTRSFDISFFLKRPDQENNPIVAWNEFKIQDINSAIKKEKLYTNNLGPCYALCAQVYNLKGGVKSHRSCSLLYQIDSSW